MRTRKPNKFHLNGNTGWITVLLFLITQTGAAIFWAGSINTSVKFIQEEIRDVKQDIARLENKTLLIRKDTRS